MAKAITFKFRSPLPGAGFDASGIPQQGKEMVVGRISISSYTASGTFGEPLTAAELGLTNVDWVNFRVISTADVAAPTQTAVDAGAQYEAHWDGAKLMLWEKTVVTGQYGAVAGGNVISPDNTDAAVVDFCAVGDSSRNVELF